MDVWFKSRVLQVCYEKHKEGTKRWNQKVARLYIQRINIIFACASAKDLATFPHLRFHQGKGERKGYYYIYIDRAWRITMSFDKTMRKVSIEEVSNHYGD